MIDLEEELINFDENFKYTTKHMPMRGKGTYNKIKAQVKKYIIQSVEDFEQVDKILSEIETTYSGYKFHRIMGNIAKSHIWKEFDVNDDYILEVGLQVNRHYDNITLNIRYEYRIESNDYHEYLISIDKNGNEDYYE